MDQKTEATLASYSPLARPKGRAEPTEWQKEKARLVIEQCARNDITAWEKERCDGIIRRVILEARKSVAIHLPAIRKFVKNGFAGKVKEEQVRQAATPPEDPEESKPGMPRLI